mgnify:CR=1 FL=1
MTTPAASVHRAQNPARTSATALTWLSSAVVMCVSLFVVSVAVRGLAILLVDFPINEGSAYYVDVARNLVTGRGLVIDAMWSYSTPPLVLPRPAFELWQPLASFVAAASMSVFGTSFDGARVGGLIVGATLAPMSWLVARDTAQRLELAPRRATFAALTCGLLTAVAGPLAMYTALPDSTIPFAVLSVGACLVMPAAVGGDRRALIGLGVLLGLAYLTRLEAVWIGAGFVVLMLAARLSLRQVAARAGAVVAIVALIAAPWWLRNLAVFGSPFPGQISDNLFLTQNLQIYGYTEEISLSGFLGQGVLSILTNILVALVNNVGQVLLIPAAPITVVGAAAIAMAFRRQRRGNLPPESKRGPLAALLLTGLITLAATTVLFPVATLWGTFEHASGPILIALAVCAAFAADAFVARVRAARKWERENAWLATFGLVALTATLGVFQIVGAAGQARTDAQTIAAITANVPGMLAPFGVRGDEPVISDRPIWMSAALARPGLVLPDEPPDAVAQLARDFGARAVILTRQREHSPGAFAVGATGTQECFSEPMAIPGANGAVVFVIDRECVR